MDNNWQCAWMRLKSYLFHLGLERNFSGQELLNKMLEFELDSFFEIKRKEGKKGES